MKSITVTTQQSINYGAVLQCYALQKTIIRHGIQNEVLCFPEHTKGLYQKIPFRISKTSIIGLYLNTLNFFHRKDLLKLRERFERFKQEHIITTAPLENVADALYNTPAADFYVCGSDQVFSARDRFSSVRIMDFVRNDALKYSYAASLCEYDWNEAERTSIRQKLSSFRRISVRERFAKEYLESLLDRQVQVNFDPVFLLSEEEWDELANPPEIFEPYILCYPLLGHDQLQKTVDELKSKTGYQVICVQPHPIKRIKADQYIFDAGPAEFLGLFRNASYVVTTSFHGTAFSVIFEKPFFTLVKEYKSQRMTDLLGQLRLEERIIKASSEVTTKPIDYSYIRCVIAEERNRSNDYIREIISDVIEQKGAKQEHRYIETNVESLCCGCSACAAACPVRAISMITDQKGFDYPRIDLCRCIDCGKCSSVCAFRRPAEKDDTIQAAYALQHRSRKVLANSSSGGAFTAVSDFILDSGGVVYGAVLDTDTFLVSHKRATTKEERDLMRGSKYVQSRMEGVYRSIKDDLASEKLVLFTGTPCQCAEIASFVEDVPDKLFFLEILCYGAPSNELLVQDIRRWERKKGKKVVNYNFRSKKYGYEHTHEIEFESGEKTTALDVSRLLKLYTYSVRPSCYACRYDTRHRYGDLTVGDMWDAPKRAAIYDHRGTSVILVNSEKGAGLLEIIQSDCRIKKIDKKLNGYRTLKYPLDKPKAVTQFWDDYNVRGFEYILDKYAKITLPARLYRFAQRLLFILKLDTIVEFIRAR